MSKDNQKIILLTVIGIVVAALISWQFIANPLKKIKSLDGEISAKNERIEALDEKIRQISELEQELKDIKQTVEQFARILPDDAIREQIRLSGMIEEFVGETGIELEHFDPIRSRPERRGGGKKEAAASPAFEPNRFELLMRGHFFDIVTLINRVEKSEKFIKIDSFNLTRIRQEGKRRDLSFLQAKIVMSFYTYKPNEAG